ncbi:MAG: hypothetical protein ABR912_15135 [Terracidiphilus sp.]|jgi:hypothetical protein
MNLGQAKVAGKSYLRALLRCTDNVNLMNADAEARILPGGLGTTRKRIGHARGLRGTRLAELD